MMRFGKFLALVLVVAVALPLGACTVSPVTGRPTFTLFMSEAEEIRIGRQEHPKILAEFGGEYENPQVKAYVNSIGQLLAQTTETPNKPFTFTVLNTDVVNAFALPGGYVYITRGLMALAGDEAELAGVIGHEIGHVTARHTAERYSQAMAAGLGALVVGAATGSRAIADAAGLGGQLYLLSYSRSQEFEADSLGVRYMSRVGFDPQAMSSFLAKLQQHSALEAKIMGRPERGEAYDFFSTHPRTADRVREAVQQAGVAAVADPMRAREVYLSKIDGMLYGSDPKEGVVRGRDFLHPELRFAFRVPPGYRIVNSPTRVVAFGPGDARLLFDMADKPADGPMAYYLTEVWLPQTSLKEVETISINGLEAATGRTTARTREGEFDVRAVAIRQDVRTIYRFLFLTPPALIDNLSEELRRTTYSFRLLSASEAAGIKPLRLKVVRVAAGDTVASLARRMPFEEFAEDRFRALNGLALGQEVTPGQRVKTVVE